MPAHKRQFCPYGHDTHVTGRYSGGRCKACQKRPSREWQNARKQEAILYKGGKCHDCGMVFGPRIECADFDHRDGRTIRQGLPAHKVRRDVWHSELDQCDLVCANCHRTRTRLRALQRV